MQGSDDRKGCFRARKSYWYWYVSREWKRGTPSAISEGNNPQDTQDNDDGKDVLQTRNPTVVLRKNRALSAADGHCAYVYYVCYYERTRLSNLHAVPNK